MTDDAARAAASRLRRGRNPGLPIVFACSGCSGPAQMMAYAATQLAERGLARIGCVAALGADVPEMVESARGASHVIALDGCPLVCSAKCLTRHGITLDQHYVASPRAITDQALKIDEAERFIERVLADLLSPAQAGS